MFLVEYLYMRKMGKDILERAIKTGIKSAGYSGKTIDRRAVEALREAKLGKLLNKKEVDQKQVYAALEALKKKGLISEKVDEKSLVKKSLSEQRKIQEKEELAKKTELAAKERLHERTAKDYLHERQKEEGTDYDSIRKSRFQRDGKEEGGNGSIRSSISTEGTGERRVHLNNEGQKAQNLGWGKKSESWSRPEEPPLTGDKGQETGNKAEEPKDLPI